MLEEFTQDELDQLHHGAECRIHYHAKDFPDINDLINLEAVNPGLTITSSVSLGNSETLLTVNTSGGTITITLPPAANGREYQIIKTAEANSILIIPTVGDTILGSSVGVEIVNFGTCIHFKAVTDNFWMAI